MVKIITLQTKTCCVSISTDTQANDDKIYTRIRVDGLPTMELTPEQWVLMKIAIREHDYTGKFD